MSRFDSRVRKKGHCLTIFCSSARRSLRLPAVVPSHDSMALPKPHQPGSATRHWPQEKPQGIARRSSMRRPALREAGREPMFSSAISRIGVASKK
jgi:hypothetical protein